MQNKPQQDYLHVHRNSDIAESEDSGSEYKQEEENSSNDEGEKVKQELEGESGEARSKCLSTNCGLG